MSTWDDPNHDVVQDLADVAGAPVDFGGVRRQPKDIGWRLNDLACHLSYREPRQVCLDAMKEINLLREVVSAAEMYVADLNSDDTSPEAGMRYQRYYDARVALTSFYKHGANDEAGAYEVEEPMEAQSVPYEGCDS